jgi:hypothetical protein
MRAHSLALVATAALIAGCIFAPYPSYPVVVSTPASFDRSWDAALGAAEDAGVQVTLADRMAGRITGTNAGAAVTIELRQFSDGSVQVRFSAPDSKEINPKLSDRWLSAYNRRMGR